MRALLVIMALAAGLAIFNAQGIAADADLLADSDDALLFAGEADALATAQQQRSLLAASGTPAYPPTYCFNSHIKPVFTAKVAVLLRGTRRYDTVTASDYTDIAGPRIAKRLRRYNKRYKLKLSYSIVTKTNASLKFKQQKWFYFEITFRVGTCGRYKFPLITQLRGDIQPRRRASRAFIKRIRLQTYPFK